VFIGVFVKIYAVDTRDHLFMFGKIINDYDQRTIKGIFVGKIDHGYVDVTY